MSKRSTKDAERPFKRINSKEEVIADDGPDDHANDAQNSVSASVEDKPRQIFTASQNRVASTRKLKDITIALLNPKKREQALKATEAALCSESLKCLLAIMDWESLDASEKVEGANRIIYSYVLDDATAVCVPDSMKARLRFAEPGLTVDELTDTLWELKKMVLNDLRFNNVFLEVLNDGE